jgi:hypothetical protein
MLVCAQQRHETEVWGQNAQATVTKKNATCTGCPTALQHQEHGDLKSMINQSLVLIDALNRSGQHSAGAGTGAGAGTLVAWRLTGITRPLTGR